MNMMILLHQQERSSRLFSLEREETSPPPACLTSTCEIMDPHSDSTPLISHGSESFTCWCFWHRRRDNLRRQSPLIQPLHLFVLVMRFVLHRLACVASVCQ